MSKPNEDRNEKSVVLWHGRILSLRRGHDNGWENEAVQAGALESLTDN